MKSSMQIAPNIYHKLIEQANYYRYLSNKPVGESYRFSRSGNSYIRQMMQPDDLEFRTNESMSYGRIEVLGLDTTSLDSGICECEIQVTPLSGNKRIIGFRGFTDSQLLNDKR